MEFEKDDYTMRFIWGEKGTWEYGWLASKNEKLTDKYCGFKCRGHARRKTRFRVGRKMFMQGYVKAWGYEKHRPRRNVNTNIDE